MADLSRLSVPNLRDGVLVVLLVRTLLGDALFILEIVGEAKVGSAEDRIIRRGGAECIGSKPVDGVGLRTLLVIRGHPEFALEECAFLDNQACGLNLTAHLT